MNYTALRILSSDAHFAPLITLGSILRSRLDLQLEILALLPQIGVLERSVHKRPRLTSTDRLLWVSLFRIWRDWRSTLLIVKPEPVVAWHRRGFRLFWSWKVGHGNKDGWRSPARLET